MKLPKRLEKLRDLKCEEIFHDHPGYPNEFDRLSFDDGFNFAAAELLPQIELLRACLLETYLGWLEERGYKDSEIKANDACIVNRAKMVLQKLTDWENQE